MYLDVRTFEAAGKKSLVLQFFTFIRCFLRLAAAFRDTNSLVILICVEFLFSDKQAITRKLTAGFTEENCSSVLVCVIGIVAARYPLIF